MTLTTHTLIPLFQAMQLVALAPCLFVIIYLLLRRHERRLVIVPCLYFTALAASFLLPLAALWVDLGGHAGEKNGFYVLLLYGQSLVPALSFLLIIQFAIGGVPPLAYWLILMLPLVGGSGVVYGTMQADEICLQSLGCLSASAVEGLYSVFSNAVIFLLLVALFARTRLRGGGNGEQSRNMYWLVVALIGLNLLSTAVDLMRISGALVFADALFISTILRMTFIYVVLTLLFRVFDRPVEASATVPKRSPAQRDREDKLIEAFETLMEKDLHYREMGCSRETVARALGVNENMLSRIVNRHYQLRFTEVVNQYRVKEAQRLLVADTEQPVTDIAFEVGFNSIPSFNRVFKESSGFSPTEYRALRSMQRPRR